MKTQYRPEAYSLEQTQRIFGTGSNSGEAHKVMRQNATRYAELKQVACYRDNLIPESTLPLDSRLTKEELEQHHERLTMGELMTVPLDLAAQFGIAPGTKLTKAKIRQLQGKE